MNKLTSILIVSLLIIVSFSCAKAVKEQPVLEESISSSNIENNEPIVVGAQRFEEYLGLLQNKRVGLVVNPTSMIEENHLVDVLQEKGIHIKKVFAPEHGFRGKADAGEVVKNGRDAKTGLPIISLYGSNKKPSSSQLKDLDVLVFDIQDVGARFYTYISTLEYVMEACAEQGKQLVVLDRPNPNGYYVDGPVLKSKYKSFVGMQEIPIVHGMTVGEYAQFLNGERLLTNGVQANLVVVPCKNYSHKMQYHLPVAPSPNLPNEQAIALYPSLCLFEGTTVSVGRGTNKQFQIYGHPSLESEFVFMPVPMEGAKNPKHKNTLCYGEDLSNRYVQGQLDLSYLLNTYKIFKNKNIKFFNKNNFFNKLAGYDLKEQIISGMSEDQIRATWQPDLNTFKQTRKKYLLYQDFE